MCNRYLSRKWADERPAFVAAAGQVVKTAAGIDATIEDLRALTFARQQIAATKAVDLLRRAESRADRRGRKLAIARRAAKIVGAYSDLRGSDDYQLFDQAKWLLVRLNRLIEEAVVDRDLRAAYDDNLASDLGLRYRFAETPGAVGLPAFAR